MAIKTSKSKKRLRVIRKPDGIKLHIRWHIIANGNRNIGARENAFEKSAQYIIKE
jgi:hypothetical protein